MMGSLGVARSSPFNMFWRSSLASGSFFSPEREHYLSPTKFPAKSIRSPTAPAGQRRRRASGINSGAAAATHFRHRPRETEVDAARRQMAASSVWPPLMPDALSHQLPWT